MSDAVSFTFQTRFHSAFLLTCVGFPSTLFFTFAFVFAFASFNCCCASLYPDSSLLACAGVELLRLAPHWLCALHPRAVKHPLRHLNGSGSTERSVCVRVGSGGWGRGGFFANKVPCLPFLLSFFAPHRPPAVKCTSFAHFDVLRSRAPGKRCDNRRFLLVDLDECLCCFFNHPQKPKKVRWNLVVRMQDSYLGPTTRRTKTTQKNIFQIRDLEKQNNRPPPPTTHRKKM